MNKLFLLSGFLLLLACQDQSSSDQPPAEDHGAAEVLLFDKTDSLELIRYPDPAEQKNYEVYHSGDTGLIRLLTESLNAPGIAAEVCPHYKKLYLLSHGEVFKTIYVSDSCGYLAFAVDGRQEFRQLDAALKKKLDKAFE